MQRTFRLIHHESGLKANLYKISFVDEPVDEFMTFLEQEDGRLCDANAQTRCQTCKRVCDRPLYLGRLLDTIDMALHDYGFRDDFFGSISKYPYPVGALRAGPYRLYGLRYSSELFIAGSGGVKHSRRISDDPVLQRHFENVRYVERHLEARLRDEYDGRVPVNSVGLHYLDDGLLDFTTLT